MIPFIVVGSLILSIILYFVITTTTNRIEINKRKEILAVNNAIADLLEKQVIFDAGASRVSRNRNYQPETLLEKEIIHCGFNTKTTTLTHNFKTLLGLNIQRIREAIKNTPANEVDYFTLPQKRLDNNEYTATEMTSLYPSMILGSMDGEEYHIKRVSTSYEGHFDTGQDKDPALIFLERFNAKNN